MTRDEAEKVLALPKYAESPQQWVDRANNGNQKELIFGVTDEHGRRHSELRVEIRLNAGRRVDSKKWVFALMRAQTLYALERVYMAEIVEPSLLAHQDEATGKVYGSHERVGPETIALDPNMYDWDFQQCLEWFTRRIRLHMTNGVPDPFVLILRP